MKTILVVLLVIGVASAVPLKAPRKNLQELFTQQNFNTVLKQIQQNQDLYQSLISSYPVQYQSVAQLLASQGFALPGFGVSKIKSLFRDFDVHDLDFEGFIGSFNTQELAETANLQQFFSSELLYEILSYIFQYPNLSAVPINFLGALNINIVGLWSDLVAGTFKPEKYFTPDTIVLVMFWLSINPDKALNLAQFYFQFLPIDQTISSFIKTFNYLLSNVVNYYLVSTEQLGSLSYQQVYQKFLQTIEINPLFGNFNIQQFLSQEIINEIFISCFTNPDDTAIPTSFLTSLDLNYFNLLGQIITGTFDPEKYFTVETVFAALQWTDSHPNEVPDLVNFLLGYLPSDQVYVLMGNTLLNLGAILMVITSSNFTNLFV